jgi:hypothetical protein
LLLVVAVAVAPVAAMQPLQRPVTKPQLSVQRHSEMAVSNKYFEI